jgi:hypothetical protein
VVAKHQRSETRPPLAGALMPLSAAR